MLKKSYLLGGSLAIATAMLSLPASAVPLAPQTKAPFSLAEKVDWRGHCSRWRHECSSRWGWGTWRFRRCMVFHGCR